MNPNRRPLVAGNWKMNAGGGEGMALLADCIQFARLFPAVEVAVFPPFVLLASCSAELHESASAGVHVSLGGQNMHNAPKGAFTGEISAEMLTECGCSHVLLGHSERRQFFGETNASVATKTESAFANGLVPVICVGELLEEREAGRTLAVIDEQFDAVRPVLVANPGKPFVLAYEPVWAIGTGKTAGPAEAQEVHAHVRRRLSEISADAAAKTRVLYGGSVKPDNAKALFSCEDIDGALVGGASLDARAFGAIAHAADEVLRTR